MRKIDRAGTTYGRLTYQRCVGRNEHKQSLWEARCTCGGIWVGVVSLEAQSCGCLLEERNHGPKPCNEDHRRKISEAKSRKDTEHTCPVCDKPFMGTKTQKHCSKKCGRIFREKYEGRRAKHWTRLTGALYEPIDFWKVYNRDGGICQICFIEVPRDLRGSQTNMLAPELEHIVPLSRGGNHIYANVRLAHRGCNNEKADSLPEGIVPKYSNPDPRTRVEKIRDAAIAQWKDPVKRLRALNSMVGRATRKPMTLEERVAMSVNKKAYWSTRRTSQSAITSPQA